MLAPRVAISTPWTQKLVGSRGASRAAAQYGRAIVDGVVYWGSGYNTEAREMPCDGNNNKLSAFSLGGL